MLFVGVATVPAAAAPSDTMQFRYNASHSGDYSPVAGSVPSNGQLKWNYTTGDAVISSPAVANGVVYVGSDDGKVYALNSTTGAKLWSYTTGNWVSSSPAVANGVVYIGFGDGNLYALNATTGTKLWNYTTGSYVSSPAVVNGVVYGGSDDNKVYALYANNGTKLWSYTTGARVHSSPAVANGVVYVGNYDGKVYALYANNGTKLWSYTTGARVYSSPAVANGVIYIGSQNNKVYALYANNGTELWYFVTRRNVESSPAIANGVVYVGSDDGKVYAIGTQSPPMTPTKLSITASTTTPAVNQPVTFTATLKSGTKLLASKPVTIYHYLNGVKYTDTTKTTNANGQITLTQSFGSAGKRTYYATFAGDSSYAATTSSVLNVNVKAPIRVTLAASTTTPAVNQKVTFTAKLYWWNSATNQWALITTGKPVTIYHYLNGVRYTDKTINTDSSGKVTLTQSFSTKGQRTYYSTFAGDTWYKASTSAVVTIRVH